MRRHLITFGCLVLAIGLYLIGAAYPATVIFVIGMFFEGLFWIRLLKKPKPSPASVEAKIPAESADRL